MESRPRRSARSRSGKASRTGRPGPRRASWKVWIGHSAWALGLAVVAIAVFEAGSNASLHPGPSGLQDADTAVEAEGQNRASVPLQPSANREPEPVSAWQRHAAASRPAPGRAMITIVIDDMGVDGRHSRAAIELPGPLTTAFLPYGRHTPRMAALAKAGGHELLVHLPMAPADHTTDPGPHALRASMNGQALDAGLDWNLSRFEGYVGVNNHMGSAFTADSGAMHHVLARLADRGLLFLDSRTTRHSTAMPAAQGLDLPVLERDVFLDNVQEERAIWRQLKKVERIARRQGHAIAIGHPYQPTINALSVWLPRLEARGFVLVPLSAQARRQIENSDPVRHAGMTER